MRRSLAPSTVAQRREKSASPPEAVEEVVAEPLGERAMPIDVSLKPGAVLSQWVLLLGLHQERNITARDLPSASNTGAGLFMEPCGHVHFGLNRFFVGSSQPAWCSPPPSCHGPHGELA